MEGSVANQGNGWSPGDLVRLREGPYADFPEKVPSVDRDRGLVELMVDNFGRETRLEVPRATLNTVNPDWSERPVPSETICSLTAWNGRSAPSLARKALGGEQLPVSLRDDIDRSVDHSDGRVVVDGVGGSVDPGGHRSASTMVFSGMSGWSRCGKIEKSTMPSAVSPPSGVPWTKSSPIRGVITMLPALNPTQIVWDSDGRRSARPDCLIQWHRYRVSPPFTSRTSASRTHDFQRSSSRLGSAVSSRILPS